MTENNKPLEETRWKITWIEGESPSDPALNKTAYVTGVSSTEEAAFIAAMFNVKKPYLARFVSVEAYSLEDKEKAASEKDPKLGTCLWICSDIGESPIKRCGKKTEMGKDKRIEAFCSAHLFIENELLDGSEGT